MNQVAKGKLLLIVAMERHSTPAYDNTAGKVPPAKADERLEFTERATATVTVTIPKKPKTKADSHRYQQPPATGLLRIVIIAITPQRTPTNNAHDARLVYSRLDTMTVIQYCMGCMVTNGYLPADSCELLLLDSTQSI